MIINGEDNKVCKISLIIYLYMLLMTNLGLQKKVILTSFIKYRVISIACQSILCSQSSLSGKVNVSVVIKGFKA